MPHHLLSSGIDGHNDDVSNVGALINSHLHLHLHFHGPIPAIRCELNPPLVSAVRQSGPIYRDREVLPGQLRCQPVSTGIRHDGGCLNLQIPSPKVEDPGLELIMNHYEIEILG